MKKLLEAGSAGLGLVPIAGGALVYAGPVGNTGPASQHVTWGLPPVWKGGRQASCAHSASNAHFSHSCTQGAPVGTDAGGLGTWYHHGHAPCPRAHVLLTHTDTPVCTWVTHAHCQPGSGALSSPHGPRDPISGSGPSGSTSSGQPVSLTRWPGALVPRVEGP